MSLSELTVLSPDGEEDTSLSNVLYFGKQT
jgi:hypothetical protein